MIKFTIPGKPHAQMRPRFTKDGHAYKHTDQSKWEKKARSCALPQAPDDLITGAVNLSVRVYVKVPASWSATKTDQALNGVIRPTTRPDLSNYIKGVEDVLNRLYWVDDSQVVSFDGSGKWYGAQECMVVVVEKL